MRHCSGILCCLKIAPNCFPMRPKLHPIYTQNSSKIAHKNHHFRYQIWNKFELIPTNFWYHSDTKCIQNWTENWPKKAPKKGPKRRKKKAKKEQKKRKMRKNEKKTSPRSLWSLANRAPQIKKTFKSKQSCKNRPR